MSELMFELAEDRPLQQWQKWANLARLEAIRADKAERERDTLLAACEVVALPPYDDSDLGSLLETLRVQAQAAIAAVEVGV